MDNPYEWLRSAIDQVPELLQPLIVAAAGAIPYVEGEGAAVFGILAGVHPIIAAIGAASGNILCVILVVLLGSRVRERIISRRAAPASPTNPRITSIQEPSIEATGPVGSVEMTASSTTTATAASVPVEELSTNGKLSHREKGRQKLRRWMLKFGVPGASLLAPLALPTMLTAAFFVGSGVSKEWVLLWQVVAIVVWTTLAAVSATGALALLGW